MALKVNNQANTQTIGISPQRALPIFMPNDGSPQGSSQQLQPASGNMNIPRNAPPRLGPQRFMGSNGLPMISFPGPWSYNLLNGNWGASGRAHLAPMRYPMMLPRHINPLPVYTGGQ